MLPKSSGPPLPHPFPRLTVLCKAPCLWLQPGCSNRWRA